MQASGFDYAQALRDADGEIVDIISAAFVAQWPLDLQKMQNGLQQGDFPLVLRTAHALKGTLSLFGAVAARDCAARIESLSKESGAVEIHQMLLPLVLEVSHLLEALAARGLNPLAPTTTYKA